MHQLIDFSAQIITRTVSKKALFFTKIKHRFCTQVGWPHQCIGPQIFQQILNKQGNLTGWKNLIFLVLSLLSHIYKYHVPFHPFGICSLSLSISHSHYQTCIRKHIEKNEVVFHTIWEQVCCIQCSCDPSQEKGKQLQVLTAENSEFNCSKFLGNCLFFSTLFQVFNFCKI